MTDALPAIPSAAPEAAPEVRWFVAHVRPRCEKKLAEYCEREKFEVCLPCYRSERKYLRKKVTFQKPLFPGYVFLRIADLQKSKVAQSDYVANLLKVVDQELFIQQLHDILRALETKLDIQLVPQIGVGCRVKIKSGPLEGMDGWVEKRHGFSVVMLRLDFIGQAAAVKLDASQLEMI